MLYVRDAFMGIDDIKTQKVLAYGKIGVKIKTQDFLRAIELLH